MSNKDSKQKFLLSTTAFALCVMMGVSIAQKSYAAPVGGNVAHGNADISYGTETIINQNTSRVVIDWQGFNTNQSETVRFNQQPHYIAVNRIDGGTTNFDGRLFANGSVFLLNPDGIIFGSNSQIDVGSLLATTAGMSDAQITNFMNGSNSFSFDQSGVSNAYILVDKNAQITAADGGIVALIAPGVKNSETITANLGVVQLSAADTFAVDMYGDELVSFTLNEATSQQLFDQGAVINDGRIEANGGKIILSTKAASGILDNAIDMSGVLEANSVAIDDSGDIVLQAEGSGDINISGAMRADGYIKDTADISSNNAGNIAISADEGGISYVGGYSSVRGGDLGGNGGMVSFSSDNYIDFRGAVDARAPNGNLGTVKIDTDEIAIENYIDPKNGVFDVVSFANQLGLSNIYIVTDQDINVNNQMDATARQGSVTFDAGNDININDRFTMGGGDLNLKATNNTVINEQLSMGSGYLNIDGQIVKVLSQINAGNAAGVDIQAQQTDLAADIVAERSKLSGQSNIVNIINNNAEIQDGVDIAIEDGDIIIYDGNYTQNVVVDKRVNIAGQNGSANAVIAGNNNGAAIIHITASGTDADKIEISGLSIVNSINGDGVLVESNNIALSDINATSNDNSGIKIGGNAQNIDLANSSLSGNAKAGLEIDGNVSNVHVSNTNMIGNGGSGIEISGQISDSSFNQINAQDNGAYGIYSNANISNVAISNSTISGNSRSGIAFDGDNDVSSVTITDSQILSNDDYGVYVSNEVNKLDGLTISDSDVKDNVKTGIMIRGNGDALASSRDNIVIENSVVSGNGVGGIDYNSAEIYLGGVSGSVNISNTNIEGNNAEAGIVISGQDYASYNSIADAEQLGHIVLDAVMFSGKYSDSALIIGEVKGDVSGVSIASADFNNSDTPVAIRLRNNPSTGVHPSSPENNPDLNPQGVNTENILVLGKGVRINGDYTDQDIRLSNYTPDVNAINMPAPAGVSSNEEFEAVVYHKVDEPAEGRILSADFDSNTGGGGSNNGGDGNNTANANDADFVNETITGLAKDFGDDAPIRSVQDVTETRNAGSGYFEAAPTSSVADASADLSLIDPYGANNPPINIAGDSNAAALAAGGDPSALGELAPAAGPGGDANDEFNNADHQCANAFLDEYHENLDENPCPSDETNF